MYIYVSLFVKLKKMEKEQRAIQGEKSKRHDKFGKICLNNWIIRNQMPCWYAKPVPNAPWKPLVLRCNKE